MNAYYQSKFEGSYLGPKSFSEWTALKEANKLRLSSPSIDVKV